MEDKLKVGNVFTDKKAKRLKIIPPEEYEIWKDIKGYEGIYKISNYGRIKTLQHQSKCRSYSTVNRIVPCFQKRVNEKITYGFRTKYGYMQIRLCKDSVKKRVYVHRLVASAFLEKPKGCDFINHKDEIKDNNCVDNLEWCTQSYNCIYSKNMDKANEKKKKPVLQFTINGNFINEYPFIRIAARNNNISNTGIIKCCKGKLKTSGGYIWKYKTI